MVSADKDIEEEVCLWWLKEGIWERHWECCVTTVLVWNIVINRIIGNEKNSSFWDDVFIKMYAV